MAAVPAVPRFHYQDLMTASKAQALARVLQYLMGGGTDGHSALRLGNTVVQSIPNNEDTVLLWNQKILDNRGLWDVDNAGDIVFVEDGLYDVSVSCEFLGDNVGARDLWLELDGIEDGGDKRTVSGATDETRSYTGQIMATAGSTLRVMVKQTSGADLNTGLGHFNPRLNVHWRSRLAGQSPAFDAEDETELPPNLQAAFDGIYTQLTLINGRLNALEAVTPTPPPDDSDDITTTVRVNCGGTAFVDATGVQWDADRGYSESGTSAQGSGRTYGTPRDALYFTERWGDFTYTFTGLPPGTATLNLYFCENHPATDTVGERKFDVTVNSVLKLNDYDILAHAAGNAQHTPAMESIATAVDSDGKLVIQFTTVVNGSEINGIEILCEGTTPVPTPTDPDDPNPPPPAPTGFWYSGVTRPEIQGQYTQASVDVWSSWRKRPVNMALTYTTRNGSWDDLTNGAVLNTFTDKALVVLVAQPFAPDSLGNAANGNQARAINTGAYDAQWAKWGTTLQKRRMAGFAEAVTMLAWEFNGNWMHHSATNAAEFIAAWRRVVTAVRSTNPAAQFAWIPNAGYSQNPPSHNAQDCYPGDDYVDHTGVDLYDQYPRALGYSAVNTRETTNVGRAKYWETFARAHNKKMILQEWGLQHVTAPADKAAAGGLDNPDYIQWMWDWFSDLWADGFLFGECYFNDVATTNVYSDLLGGRNPQSSTKYRQLWLPPQP